MPMIFPDNDSLRRAAEVHKFRGKKPNETWAGYRQNLAHHVRAIDQVEAAEIAVTEGWERFDDARFGPLMLDFLFR